MRYLEKRCSNGMIAAEQFMLRGHCYTHFPNNLSDAPGHVYQYIREHSQGDTPLVLISCCWVVPEWAPVIRAALLAIPGM